MANLPINAEATCEVIFIMTDSLKHLLNSDPEAERYFNALPQYTREAVEKHADEIDGIKSMRLYAEAFMRDDSFRGA